jgi:hypothetical protein
MSRARKLLGGALVAALSLATFEVSGDAATGWVGALRARSIAENAGPWRRSNNSTRHGKMQT